MKKRVNLNKKLQREILISIFISFILIISISSIYIRKEFIKSYELNLTMIAKSIIEELKLIIKENRINEIDSFIKGIESIKGYRITIIDKNGFVLGDSILDIETMENHKSRPEIVEALNGRIGKSIRFSKSMNEDMFYVAVPFYFQNDLFVVRVSLSLNELNRVIKSLIFEISLISIFSLLIGFYILSNYSKNLTNKIELIKLKLSNIIDGKDKEKLIFKEEEFREIAEKINILKEKIEKLTKKLELERERLISSLSSIGEVVFILDKSGKITYANEKFEKFFNEKKYLNKFFWEVIKDYRIVDFIKEEGTQKFEFEELNRFYLINKIPIEKTQETVYTIFDLTSIKNLEKIKRDFVRDASHELKTPLTIIKGFIETIENEVKSKNYIEIIKRNLDRMINIINDLLTLSKLEDKREIEITKFDFRKSLENIITIFEKKIEEKGLNLYINIESNDTEIYGDQFKIEQVLINLIENAINYTDSGFIRISFKKEKDIVIFEVEDSGVGIPKEEIGRIFERFYVVDKSRSRKSGGTGLGLSIVKHIVNLHNGKIEVESELGKGTKFRITIPQKLTEI